MDTLSKMKMFGMLFKVTIFIVAPFEQCSKKVKDSVLFLLTDENTTPYVVEKAGLEITHKKQNKEKAINKI